MVSETRVILNVEAENASTLGNKSASDPNNGSSLRRLEVLEAFFLAGHGNRTECVNPNPERVGIESGVIWQG